MKNLLERFARHDRGAAAVEFAFALPLLVTLMLGILQFGIVMHATGGVRHALGEGVRFAKIYPGATEAEVLARTRGSLGGLDPAKVAALTLERGTAANGAPFARMTIRYEVEPLASFLPVPPISISQSKTVYLQS